MLLAGCLRGVAEPRDLRRRQLGGGSGGVRGVLLFPEVDHVGAGLLGHAIERGRHGLELVADARDVRPEGREARQQTRHDLDEAGQERHRGLDGDVQDGLDDVPANPREDVAQRGERRQQWTDDGGHDAEELRAHQPQLVAEVVSGCNRLAVDDEAHLPDLVDRLAQMSIEGREQLRAAFAEEPFAGSDPVILVLELTDGVSDSDEAILWLLGDQGIDRQAHRVDRRDGRLVSAE